MGNTFALRTRTKVCQTGGFLWQWVAIDVLIELCPMVPFIAKNTHGVSQPTLPYSVLITVTVARAREVGTRARLTHAHE